MAEFESVGEILQKNLRYQAFLAIGIHVKEWYLSQGYIKTNFGWMHKDWIDEAMKMKWITASHYDGVYNLVCDFQSSTKQTGTGRIREEHTITWPMIDRPKAFFRFLETKKSTIHLPEEIYRDIHTIFPKEGQQEL